MKHDLTCINCPMGCRITADYDDGKVSNIQGFTCVRGKTYAVTEITDPTRMITALVRIYGTRTPLSVKTQAPIRKPLIFDALKVIRETCVKPPVHIGDIIIENICGSGINVIATENMD